MVNNFAADLRYFRREPEAHRPLAERTVALSIEHSFPLWLAGAKSSLGWSLIERGEQTVGLSEIHQSLTLTRATGSLLNRPFILAELAAAHLRGGTIAAGLDAVAEALALTATNLDRYWEPELHRLQGELLLALREPRVEAATACFGRALELARAQDALALELRAALSQARLWHAQQRTSAARELLGGVYGRFREGFTSPDLVDAKRELDAW
jgi:predicted ATPase